jgi:glucose 1-dehydrogenase
VQDFDKVLAVNLRGAFLCAQAAIRLFLAAGTGGAIVNVSSVHQVIPKPRFVGYSVSKGGMQNLTHTLALEYAARGIRVNGLGPGVTITPINRSWVDDPVKRAAVESHTRCAVPVTPRRWPRSPRSSARTRPPTSRDTSCSWTGG